MNKFDTDSLANLKRLTHLLIMSENRLSLALDVSEIGIWEWNLSDNSLTWDINMMQLFHVNHLVTKYEDFTNTVHPDDLPNIEKKINDCIGFGTPYEYSFRVKNKDAWDSITGKGRVIRDENGVPIRMLGVCMKTPATCSCPNTTSNVQ